MPIITAVCTSPQKGTEKINVKSANLIENWGIENDAHAGNWHRQISLLSVDKVKEFNKKGANVKDGSFGENILVEGIDIASLPVGTCLKCGQVILEITQIGKECHNACAIRERVGDCIMPRQGVFAKVLKGGKIHTGMEINIAFKVAVITMSDKCSLGLREDISGKTIIDLLPKNYAPAIYKILPDDKNQLEKTLIELCDKEHCNLILTTGGTGFSQRDITPEATLAVAHKNAFGICEAIRYENMKITKKAMLSRAISVIRGNTLIVNLPGSPKAVKESMSVFIDIIPHALNLLLGKDGECAISPS